MKKNKLIPIILVSLASVLFIVAIVLLLNTNYFSFNNQTTNKETNNNQVKEENTNVNREEQKQEETKKEEVKDEVVSTPNPTPNPTSIPQKTPTPVSTPKPTPVVTPVPTPTQKPVENTETNITKNEETLISYFRVKDDNITSDVNQDDRTFREKAKDSFVAVVDFIFYDKEIKGYTFKELTTSAKLKIIKIALSIDNKIDEYFSDYKDVIKDKYTNIKGKLAVKYLEFTSTLCDKVGADTCNQAKEDFNAMKESFGFTWQLIKELASSGSTKVKEFYESWRDSE